MDSRLSTPYKDILFREPDTLMDRDLLKIPLSTLSKCLDPKLSSHSAVFVYLRWLEIHRQEETKLTQHWANTCLHWCQALRNRGLSENALVHEVEKWKEGKVFQSMSRRYPPSPFDIAKAYVNTPENTPRKWLSKDEMCLKSKESDFSGPPPPGYVCNRCGKNGHHLQVCPTNLDPGFDVPPHRDYQCPICGKYGDHYKSLCVFNTDPNSISQKRKEVERERERLKRFGREKQQDDNYHTSIYRSHNTSSSPASPSCSFPSRPGTVQQVARNLQSTKNIEVIPNFDEIESNYDEAFKPVTHKKKVYSEFVLNLIKSNDSEMTTKINHFKGRKTAIDMWEAVELEMKHSGITHCKALSLFAARADYYTPEKAASGRLTPYEDEPMEDISRGQNEDVVMSIEEWVG